MRHSDFRALFKLALLSSAIGATGSGLACGGAVDTRGGGSSSSSGGSSTSSTSSSGGSSSSSSSSSSGSTSSSSSSSGSTSSSSGGGCATGNAAWVDTYCCPEGTSCPSVAFDDPNSPKKCKVDCQRLCDAVAPGTSAFSCNWVDANTLSYYCGSCGIGRVAQGTPDCAMGESLGERLARQAYYERASVVAFERLLAALRAHGADPRLVARAQKAAEDEARHARVFAELAALHGAAPMPLERATEEPTLFALALENATEGCVRETFGALVTLHQAAHAESAEVRAAFAAIADDEAEHAALSWDLRAWFDEKLAPSERARVHQAHLRAVERARHDATAPSDALGTALGLPAPARALHMLDTLMDALHQAA